MPATGRNETVLVGVGGGGGPAGDAELGEDVLDVPTHGVLADRELLCDLAVGAPGHQPGEHLALALREAGTSRRCAARERLDAFEVEARAEFGERRPCVRRTRAPQPCGRPEQRTPSRPARRCAPPRRACAETGTRARRVAARSARDRVSLGHEHCSDGGRGHRRQQRRSRRRCHQCELVGRGAGAWNITRGPQDVDCCGQQWRVVPASGRPPQARDGCWRQPRPRRRGPPPAAPTRASGGGRSGLRAGRRRRPHRCHPQAGAARPPGSAQDRALGAAGR